MNRILIVFFCLISAQVFGQPNDSGHYIAVIGEASGAFIPDMINFDFSINATEKNN
jgi:uncharacterized protein YggE